MSRYFLVLSIENDPDPKSGRDLDSDKSVCASSCWGYVTDLAFSHSFLWFLSPIPRHLQLTLEA